MLLENIKAVAHKHIVVRLITRRTSQGVDSSRLSNGDPYLRNQNPLKVECYNRLFHGGLS